MTIAISIGLWWIATQEADLADTLRLRSLDVTIDLGVFYPVLIYLVVAGTTSAVNLTDGLDGLAGGCAAIVLLAYIGITFITTGQSDLSLLAGCLVGACVGFLWFNAFPATIFMGDTGSLGLGGAIAGFAVMTKTEELLIVLGGIFVVEALSRPAAGLLLPGLPQADLPDGPDPPPLRDPRLVGDEDHPALLDRGVRVRRDRLHGLPADRHVTPRPPLPGGPYLVVGLARSGLAVLQVLHARGERAEGADSKLGTDGLAELEHARAVVKSPGRPGRGAGRRRGPRARDPGPRARSSSPGASSRTSSSP